MNFRQKKICIFSAAVVVAALAVMALAVGFGAPVEVDEQALSPSLTTGAAPSVISGANSAAPDAKAVDLAELMNLCRMELRGPLVEPQNIPAVNVRQNAPANIGVTLVGIAREDGNSMAVLKKRDGLVQVCREGESFDNLGMQVTVVGIGPDGVTLESRSKQYKLDLPQDITQGAAR